MARGSDSEPSPTLEDWESALVRSVAARIRTTDREDLESVLAIHLLGLKARWQYAAKDWQALAATALRNKASNWIRDRQLLDGRTLSLDRPIDEGRSELDAGGKLAAPESTGDLSLAVRLARAQLDEPLQKVWDALLELNGNQVHVAERFGVHRNTVRLWIQKIRHVLIQHGLDL